MRLLIGTNNKGKIIEIGEVLGDAVEELVTPQHVNISEVPDETGNTFLENAVQKATFYHEKSGLPTIADDSGIFIEALADELGIHTRRWGAGAEASDEQWIQHFLEKMKEHENKKASFVCGLAYIQPDGSIHTFEGRCDGVITETLEAEYLPGLPISACFKPDGFEKVFSALSVEEKNHISHRGRAAAMLKNHLQYM